MKKSIPSPSFRRLPASQRAGADQPELLAQVRVRVLGNCYCLFDQVPVITFCLLDNFRRIINTLVDLYLPVVLLLSEFLYELELFRINQGILRFGETRNFRSEIK